MSAEKPNTPTNIYPTTEPGDFLSGFATRLKRQLRRVQTLTSLDTQQTLSLAIIARRRNRWEALYFYSLAYNMFLAGWNDASAGPLLPIMQTSYSVGFDVVSLIFILNCVGFVTGALINVYATDRLGFGRVMFVGSLVQVAAYAIQSTHPPFPLQVISYTLAGLGISLQDAQANAFVTNLPTNPVHKMSVAHAAYGFGAALSPVVATQFATRMGGQRWSWHFLTSLSLACVNSAVLALVFRFKREDALLDRVAYEPGTSTNGLQAKSTLSCPNLDPSAPPIDSHASNPSHAFLQSSTVSSASDVPQEISSSPPLDAESASTITVIEESTSRKYGLILRSNTVRIFALFLFIYVGMEDTIGGWIVTFIMNHRGGGAASGYVSSGFWGGLTLGRLGLTWSTNRVGRCWAVYMYLAITLGLQLSIWFFHSLLENAIAVSIVGIALGPIYPILMMMASECIPPEILTGSIGWIASIGQTGSAFFPFIVGLIARRNDVRVLSPILVGLISTLTFLWFFVSRLLSK